MTKKGLKENLQDEMFFDFWDSIKHKVGEFGWKPKVESLIKDFNNMPSVKSFKLKGEWSYIGYLNFKADTTDDVKKHKKQIIDILEENGFKKVKVNETFTKWVKIIKSNGYNNDQKFEAGVNSVGTRIQVPMVVRYKPLADEL